MAGNEFCVKNGLIVKSGTITVGDPGTTGYTFPSATGTQGQSLTVDASGDLTFTTIGGASAFLDNAFAIQNHTTPSKQIAFNAVNISSSTIRTITMPDADVNLGLVNSALQPSANISTLTNNLNFISGITVQDDGSNVSTTVTTLNFGTNVAVTGSGATLTINASGGAATTPGGSNTQIQYNNAGAFDGITGLTTNGTNTLTMVGTVTVGNLSLNGNTLSSTDTNGNVILDPNGTGSVNVSSARIINLADPSSAQDAATKNYVDNMSMGLDAKGSVKVATTGSITLSGAQTIDGVALSVGDRVLVKNQSTPADNGIYIVSSSTWTRATDMDAWTKVPNAFTFVEQGTTLADTGWLCTSNQGGTLNTTSITWTQFGSGGTTYTADNNGGLSLTANAFGANTSGLTTTIITNKIVVGSTSAQTDKYILGGNSANTEASWAYVSALRDSGGDVGIQVSSAAASYIDITSTSTGINFTATSSGSNVDLTLTPKGSGVVLAPSGYDMSSASSLAFATKGYVDSAEATSAANVGTGAGHVYRDVTGFTLNLKTLKAGSNITITDNTDDITIAATGTGEANTASNLGSGTGVFASKSGVDLRFKSLLAGSNVSLSNTGTDITIGVTGVLTSPGGSDTYVQYNSGGTVLGGNAAFTFNPSGTILSIDNLRLDGNTISSTDTNGNVTVNPNGTGKFEIGGVYYSQRQTLSIANAQTNTLIFSYTAASNEATHIDYAIRRSTTGSRTGTLFIINDGTSVSISDVGADLGDAGITFTAAINGTNVDVKYSSTSTGTTGNMSYVVRQMDVA